jgi:predicted Fe-S protein YdhL (DUF1289 family)
MAEEVKSPCIKVCKYDEESVCIGCHRSMKEITGWIFMSIEEKEAVLKNAQIRKQTPRPGRNDYEYYV